MKDLKTQDLISSIHRRISRRNFIGKVAAMLAGVVATILVGPFSGVGQYVSASTYACSPPNGTYCTFCQSNGNCPLDYITCKKGESLCSACIYTTGWWYTAGTVGNRHKCYDCAKSNGPINCSDPKILCGCRSTIHY